MSPSLATSSFASDNYVQSSQIYIYPHHIGEDLKVPQSTNPCNVENQGNLLSIQTNPKKKTNLSSCYLALKTRHLVQITQWPQTGSRKTEMLRGWKYQTLTTKLYYFRNGIIIFYSEQTWTGPEPHPAIAYFSGTAATKAQSLGLAKEWWEGNPNPYVWA